MIFAVKIRTFYNLLYICQCLIIYCIFVRKKNRDRWETRPVFILADSAPFRKKITATQNNIIKNYGKIIGNINFCITFVALTKPNGRIPVKIMRFKIDENLKKVVAAMTTPKDPEIVAKELCAKMIDAGIWMDDPYNYGVSIMDVTEPIPAVRLLDVLFDYLGVTHISGDVHSAFCNIIIMGDGLCPECGGDIKFVEAEGHELHDGDYWTPNSWVVDKYVYQCRECGEIIKSDDEL